MTEKGFLVRIRLDLHAVTCPGVWLCPNGKVGLRITIFGSAVESRRVSPIFPLLLHEKFIFERMFLRLPTLTDLQRNLEMEAISAELIQRINRRCASHEILLATFERSLADLLYPETCCKGLLAGVELDMLMEPTEHFPGIIVPKIEISTKTDIEERLSRFTANNVNNSYIINPKTIDSKRTPCARKRRPVNGIIRQKKVCHTQGKTKSEINHRPFSASHRRSDSSNPRASRSCTCPACSCTCACTCALSRQKAHPKKCYHTGNLLARCTKEIDSDICTVSSDIHHQFSNCPVCSKYHCYFTQRYEEPKSVNGIRDRRKRNKYIQPISDESHNDTDDADDGSDDHKDDHNDRMACCHRIDARNASTLNVSDETICRKMNQCFQGRGFKEKFSRQGTNFKRDA